MHTGVDSGAVLRGLLLHWAVLQEFDSQLGWNLMQRKSNSSTVIILEWAGTTSLTEDLNTTLVFLASLLGCFSLKLLPYSVAPSVFQTLQALQLLKWAMLLPWAVIPQALWWRYSELTRRMDSGSNIWFPDCLAIWSMFDQIPLPAQWRKTHRGEKEDLGWEEDCLLDVALFCANLRCLHN